MKNTETTRELVFDGPASLLACERGEERFLLTSGDVHTTTWAGARPGAEVLLGTPFGAVRYGDAKLDVHVDEKGLLVASEVGDAWVELPRGAGKRKFQPADASVSRVMRRMSRPLSVTARSAPKTRRRVRARCSLPGVTRPARNAGGRARTGAESSKRVVRDSGCSG